jgi:hypothetical protein
MSWRQILAEGRRRRESALQYAWAERRKAERQRDFIEAAVILVVFVVVMLGVMP